MFGKMLGYMPRVNTNGKVVLVGPHNLQLPTTKCQGSLSCYVLFVKAINQPDELKTKSCVLEQFHADPMEIYSNHKDRKSQGH